MRLIQWNRVCTIIDQIGYIIRSKKNSIIIDLGIVLLSISGRSKRLSIIIDLVDIYSIMEKHSIFNEVNTMEQSMHYRYNGT
jgi:hypothetical protein